MVKKLMSRTEFSDVAGVSPAAITKACSKALKAAVVGKRINANHPDAAAYVAEKTGTAPLKIIDPLYEEAIAYCYEADRFSITGLQQKFKIGYSRASKIVDTMRTNGLIPEVMQQAKIIETPPPEKKKPHVRGTASARQKKKKTALKLAAVRAVAKEPDEETQIFEIPEDIEAFADMTLRELLDRFGTDTAFVDWLAATQKIEAINEKRLKNAQTKGTLISRELVKVGVIDTFNSAHLRLLKDGAKSIAAGVISKHSSGAELSEVEAFVSDILGSFIKPIKNKIARVLKNA